MRPRLVRGARHPEGQTVTLREDGVQMKGEMDSKLRVEDACRGKAGAGERSKEITSVTTYQSCQDTRQDVIENLVPCNMQHEVISTHTHAQTDRHTHTNSNTQRTPDMCLTQAGV